MDPYNPYTPYNPYNPHLQQAPPIINPYYYEAEYVYLFFRILSYCILLLIPLLSSISYFLLLHTEREEDVSIT